ncbi:hypothetical protein BC826DRAFT_972267, partial [Russula brevipes]
MAPTTRPKNASQRPGLIMLADTKKRRTKDEIAAEFIAQEEDRLAEDEAATNAKIIAPSRRPVPLVRQNAVIFGYKRDTYVAPVQVSPQAGKRALDDKESECENSSTTPDNDSDQIE